MCYVSWHLGNTSFIQYLHTAVDVGFVILQKFLDNLLLLLIVSAD